MDANKNNIDDEIIWENQAYILGLYDLYQNDKDIEEVLAQKGLTNYQVLLILKRTKQERLQKRLRQAKRLFISGLSVSTGLWLVYFFFKNLPGADTLMDGDKPGEGMLQANFILYREVFYFVMFGFSCQALLGAILFIERKRAWNKFVKTLPDTVK